MHRLDMDTTGVVLFGKTKRAAKELNAQLRRREWSKVYHAVCFIDEHRDVQDAFRIDARLQAAHDGSGYRQAQSIE